MDAATSTVIIATVQAVSAIVIVYLQSKLHNKIDNVAKTTEEAAHAANAAAALAGQAQELLKSKNEDG